MKRLRFSLRTLFAVVTVLGILCAFVLKVGQARHQKNIVDQIRQMGGGVDYECDVNGEPGALKKWLIDTCGKDFCSDVRRVWARTGFDDSKLDRLIPLLKELPTVQTLDLGFTDITDREVNKLTPLQWLPLISFLGTDINKGAVEELRVAMPRTRIARTLFDVR